MQFETIHPHLDGNGRIGRLLITLLLEHWKILSQPLLYLSLFFKQHRAEYYRLLNAVRLEGAWEAWVTFFLEGRIDHCGRSVVDSSRSVRPCQQRPSANPRRAQQLRDRCEAARATAPTPDRDDPHDRKMLKTTKPTAAKAVSVLERLKILKETTGRRRDRAYTYTAYLERLRAGTELVEWSSGARQ